MPTASEELQSSVNRRVRWGELCRAALDLGLCLFFVAAVAGYLGRLHHLLELTSHFRLQYTALAALFLLMLLAWRRWYLAAVCGGVLLANLAALAPYPLAAASPSVTPKHRALLLNLYVLNPHHERVRQLVKDNDPDFIVFSELSAAWMAALEPLHEQYAHRLLPSAHEAQEEIQVGVYSKRPLRDARREPLVELARPCAIARVDLGPEPLLLISPHPRIPLSAMGWHCRNAELQAIADLAIFQPAAPVMVLGDLNVTCFSPAFSDFVRRSGLRDSQLDFGLQCSWPTDHFFLRIPIDHCLTSHRVVVQRRWLGPNVGSDHFPVLVDFSIRPAE
jgi:endonuclease/exonuclease/phosphatase (EEP) superfamily protein YafD